MNRQHASGSFAAGAASIPAYPSKARLAAELDMAESTVDEMVRRGVLPGPMKLSTGCVRWCWTDVVTAMASLKDGAIQAEDGRPAPSSDPYIAGAQNVITPIKPREGQRGAS
jgi:predicted DNA-binding transcriptional regulator AlpA